MVCIGFLAGLQSVNHASIDLFQLNGFVRIGMRGTTHQRSCSTSSVSPHTPSAPYQSLTLMNRTETFKIWYTLRLFVPPPVPSRLTVESKLIPNLYSFWVLNEIGTMIACIPAITRVLERTEVSSRIITMLGVLILTCSYPNQGLGVSPPAPGFPKP
jgi:hypothetical protein